MRKLKLLSRAELSSLHDKYNGKTIVALSGSFDVLHIGHIRAFEEAKSYGDVLVVLLNSDSSVKKYKGPNRPLVSEEERAEMLMAIEFIDYVIIFDEINPKNALRELKPDIYCQGKDWGEDCLEKETVLSYGGKIKVLQWQKGRSTTDLVRRILDSARDPIVKAVFFDRDGTINFNEPEYLYRIEDFRFKPGTIKGLKMMASLGYRLFIVTNQSGIKRGYFNVQDLEKLHEWLVNELAKFGIKIDKIYYCPHLPDDDCECRKPKPGMLLKAVEEFGVNLSKSWMIGDSQVDMDAGKEANLRTILISENNQMRNLKEAAQFISENK